MIPLVLSHDGFAYYLDIFSKYSDVTSLIKASTILPMTNVNQVFYAIYGIL